MPELSYAGQPAAMAFADELAERRGLDRNWVRQQIGQAVRLERVMQLVLPPPTSQPKNWAAYRARFIEPKRIEAGLQFWQTHREALARAEAAYGVPASLIVGVLGVETFYGRHLGNFRVLDTLATLALDFPSAHPRTQTRQTFFRDELEQFLAFTHRAGTDPASYRGSYAGAMGWPQFMPSSWDRYAVDFDGDGKVDLFGSPVDAIGSVANYFHQFGWQPGMPTHFPVGIDAAQADMEVLLAPDILPTFTVAGFIGKGARLEGPALEHTGKLALVELRNGNDAPSYVAGTENFYVVTRYNWSSYYAMAVIELGQAVEARLR